MSAQSQDDTNTHNNHHYSYNTHAPAQPRSSTKRDSLRRFSFDNKSARIVSFTSGSCSSTEWDSDMDRTTMRGLDSSSSDDDMDDDDDDATSEEQSESDSDRRRIPSQQHLPVSVKRRKVSIDEDYERLLPLQLPDEIETRPTNMISSNKQRQSRPNPSSASSPPLSNNHRRHQSTATATTTTSTRPSSWPARKRRSFITEPKTTSTTTTFSFSELLSKEPSSSSSSSSSSSPLSTTGLDTTSLSLLSETSALVSEGTISSLDSDNASLRALLEPPSSSPSLLSSSPSSTSCFSLILSADSPFLSTDRAHFNAQELFKSARPPTSSSSSSSPSLLSLTTTTATVATTLPATRSRYQRYHQQQPLLSACRKRTFEDAIELTRPLGNDPSVEHAGWLGSIKRRKIHHFPTRWTSSLSPSPYIKLLAMRDFWDVMMTRLDLSWLNLWTASGAKSETLRGFNGGASDAEGGEDEEIGRVHSPMESEAEAEADEMDTEQENANRSSTSENNTTVNTTQKQKPCVVPERPQLARISSLKQSDDKDGTMAETIDSPWSMCVVSRRKKRTVVQHPSAALFLRGLWEEEEHCRRQKQMIPESVHKPLRSKVFNRKPLVRIDASATKVSSASAESQGFTTGSGSSATLKETSSSGAPSLISESSTSTSSVGASADESDSNHKEDSDTHVGSNSNAGDQDMVLIKKHGPTAALRSNALSEGYDLNEYKPWKDATITPHRGCIQTLRQMRCTMLEPWPAEESRAKDECSRILHVMREQLNVVINLQIHLRSMIKTAPQQMSFLLSIRHPGQISIELLNALYGPQFMHTNAFRSIEQLLWGKSHSWKAGESSPSLSSSSLQHHRPPSQLTRYTSPSSSSQSSPPYSQQHQYQQRQQYAEHPYHNHHQHDMDDEHDSMLNGTDNVRHYQEHHYQDHGDHDDDYEHHRRQYPQQQDYDHEHNHDHDHDQVLYQGHSQHSYYDYHQPHHEQQQQHHSTTRQHRHNYEGEQSSSLQYTPTAMEDVSECVFEDELDEPSYQDPLLEIESIDTVTTSTTTDLSVVEREREQQRKSFVTISMDGGYESGGDVSEGEIEALEISSSSSSLTARSFRR
ncbi:hypothetical protein BGZ47_008789 [Haplosporangium gracile]|nr:hypothetical protein BGZ47_008789 [Haplosporangium gracile]